MVVLSTIAAWMFDGGAEGTTHNKTVGYVAHEPLLVTRITPIRAGRDLTKPRIHNTFHPQKNHYINFHSITYNCQIITPCFPWDLFNIIQCRVTSNIYGMTMTVTMMFISHL